MCPLKTLPEPQSQWLTTRDGIRLHADVYMPAGDGPWPVLLMRQPYGSRIASTTTFAHPSWYAAHGYLVVIQDVRGRGRSEGVFDPLAHEFEDARDTLDWVAGMAGSNGAVGMYGFSYQGATQLFAAATGHPALKTICPAMCPFSTYEDWVTEGGALRLALVQGWAAQMAAETARLAGDHEMQACLRELAWAPGEAGLFDVGGSAARQLLAGSHYDDWLSHGPEDAYWAQRSPSAVMPAINLPALHIGGWFDFFLSGTLRTYRHFLQGNPGQRLMIGPWTHIPWSRGPGQAWLPENAVAPIDRLLIQWFDHHLKGIDNGVDRLPAVSLYDLRAQGWRDMATYPEPSPSRLYLVSDGLACTTERGGSLQASVPESVMADTLVHDPWRPVPLVGGHLPPQMGLCDRREVDARSDVATYTSAPLQTPLQLMGPVALMVDVSADHESFDVCASLSVVSSDGAVTSLTQGVLRAGADGLCRVDMRHVCASMMPGECLRVSLSGAAYPAVGLNSGRTQRPIDQRAADFPVITLRINAASSWLELPVVAKAD